MPNEISVNGGQLNPAVVTASRGSSSMRSSTPISAGSSALGLISPVFSGIVTAMQNSVNRSWQAEQAKLAYDRQVEQWRRENSYNSPVAMAARLRAAGINVNDAFSGQGAATAGGLSSVQMPNYTPLDVASSMASMLGSFSSLRGSSASLLNAGANVFNAKTNAGRLALDTDRMQYLNALTSAQINQLAEQVRNTAIDSDYKSVLLKYLDSSEQIRLTREIADIELTAAQKSYLQKQIEYYAPEVQSRISLNYSSAANQRKGVEYMDELIGKVQAETEHELVKMGLTEKQARYYGAQAVTSMISQSLNSVANVAGAVSSFTPFGAAGRAFGNFTMSY